MKRSAKANLTALVLRGCVNLGRDKSKINATADQVQGCGKASAGAL
jgi:hypothetical protein